MDIDEIRHFEQLDQSLLKQIIRWSDEAFGRGYLAEEYLQTQMLNGVLLLVKNKEQASGVALLLEQEQADLPELIRDKMNSDSKALYRKSLIVNPNFRGKGISKALNKQISILAKSYHLVYSSLWNEGTPNRYETQLLNEGYIEAGRIDNYWRVDNVSRAFVCAACKKIPCSCSANIFYQLKP